MQSYRFCGCVPAYNASVRNRGRSFGRMANEVDRTLGTSQYDLVDVGRQCMLTGLDLICSVAAFG